MMALHRNRAGAVVAYSDSISDQGATRLRATGLAWGLLAVAVWSGAFVLIRLGVTTTLNAYDITALRFGFGGALLLPVAVAARSRLTRLGALDLMLLVAGQGAPYALLVGIGLRFAPAWQGAAFVPGLMAVIAAILGRLILRERMPRRAWSGAGMILLGTVLIGGLSFGGHQTPGQLLFLSAASVWAGYVIALRRTGLAALQATALVAVGSAIVYLPIYAIWLPSRIDQAPLTDILLQAIYQGGMTTVVGLIAFNRAVESLGAAAGAALPALVPVVTLATGYVFLGEAVGPADITAAFLIAVGVLAVTSRQISRRKE